MKPKDTGTLDELTATLWAAIGSAEGVLSDPEPEVRLRAAATLAQLAGHYAKLYPQREAARTWGTFEEDLARRFGV